jgi:hypothetical protein
MSPKKATADEKPKLSKIRCLRYAWCKTKAPNFGFIPIRNVQAAETRNEEAKYCSPTCRHSFLVAKGREKKKAGLARRTS